MNEHALHQRQSSSLIREYSFRSANSIEWPSLSSFLSSQIRRNDFTSRSGVQPRRSLLSKDLTRIPRNVHGKANAARQDVIQDALPPTLIPLVNPTPDHPPYLATEKRNPRPNIRVRSSSTPFRAHLPVPVSLPPSEFTRGEYEAGMYIHGRPDIERSRTFRASICAEIGWDN